MSRSRASLFALLLAALALVAAACGSDSNDSSSKSSDAASTTASSEPVTLRLGYFPNVTHAPALVAKGNGTFEQTLGKNVTVKYSSFNAGPEAVEAISSGALDATFIGPNPTITAWSKTKAVHIVSGAASGGAFLVVKPDINDAKDLEGKKLATPQLGGTQDIAARTRLKEKGLKTDPAGGGDVNIVPQENAQTLDTFKQNQIQAAWVPEPWATRLVKEAGGKILVDEADLWPNGQYVTTQLIVSEKFLKDHPDVVKNLILANAKAIEYTKTNRSEAETLVAKGIEEVTGKPIKPELVTASFDSITFTTDPIASSLKKSAKDAQEVGLGQDVSLKGLYELKLLNEVRKDLGESKVSDT